MQVGAEGGECTSHGHLVALPACRAPVGIMPLPVPPPSPPPPPLPDTRPPALPVPCWPQGSFASPVPLPSVGRPASAPPGASSPSAPSTDMWRGPMWVNINYLVARGLLEQGDARLSAMAWELMNRYAVCLVRTRRPSQAVCARWPCRRGACTGLVGQLGVLPAGASRALGGDQVPAACCPSLCVPFALAGPPGGRGKGGLTPSHAELMPPAAGPAHCARVVIVAAGRSPRLSGGTP
jgi:hypothetical protein